MEIYSNPKKVYNSLSDEEKESFERIISDYKKGNTGDCNKKFFNPNKLSLSDKLLIYSVESFKGAVTAAQ